MTIFSIYGSAKYNKLDVLEEDCDQPTNVPPLDEDSDDEARVESDDENDDDEEMLRLKNGLTCLFEEREFAPRTVAALESRYSVSDLEDRLEAYYASNFAQFVSIYKVDSTRSMKAYTTTNIGTHQANVHDAAILSAFVLQQLFSKETFRPHHDATVSLCARENCGIDYDVVHEALRTVQEIYDVQPLTTVQTVSVETMISREMIRQVSLKSSEKNDEPSEKTDPATAIKKVIRKARKEAIKEVGKYAPVVRFDDLVEEHTIPEDEAWPKEQSYSGQDFLEAKIKEQKRRAKLAQKQA